MSFLNLISLIGILGLCAIAWLCSENRQPQYFPWRTVIVGLLIQAVLGLLVFVIPGTQTVFQVIGTLFNGLFEAADAGARFIFGKNLVPIPGQEPFLLTPLTPGASGCAPDTAGQIVPGFCAIGMGYIYAFRAFPSVIFLTGLTALFYRLGVIQAVVDGLAKGFYRVMGLSGAEALSGITNIFVSIEALIAIKLYLARMTRSELCAVMACAFGTAASAALPSYASFLKPLFPNVMAHLAAASIMAIPACFLLAKILVPETEVPQTVPKALSRNDTDLELAIDDKSWSETEWLDKATAKQISPVEATIAGTLEGLKIVGSIVAVVILTLGVVYFIVQGLGWLATLPDPIGGWFKVLTLQNLLGVLFLPFTVLTGISLSWQELWQSSMLVGRRLFETAVFPYQSLAAAASIAEPARLIEDRAVLILTYTLAGFANLAFWGVLVGGTIALAPSRRRDVIELSGRALLAGTLATLMVGSFVGLYDGMFGTNAARTLGKPDAPPAAKPVPSSLLPPMPPAPIQIAPPLTTQIPATQTFTTQTPNIPVV
ncbi:MAG TPA: nucleoside transporter C-terminal domain-containing protein [Allocoleopsis sp.]